MTTVKIERAFIHLRSHIDLYIIHKNPINFRVQISPRVKTMHNAWIFFPNFFIEYFSLQTSAKIIHR